jgi:hypothetical protein
MKQMTIPQSSYYSALPPERKKQSPLRIGQTTETVYMKLSMVLTGCHNYSKDRTILHISIVTCYDPRDNQIGLNPIFLTTPCWCIRFEDGRIVSISKHLPYQGDCKP